MGMQMSGTSFALEKNVYRQGWLGVTTANGDH